MTPTPEQAKAELQRRKDNKVKKAKGEEWERQPDQELITASTKQLKEWAK